MEKDLFKLLTFLRLPDEELDEYNILIRELK
jgi:hypothetical protein